MKKALKQLENDFTKFTKEDKNGHHTIDQRVIMLSTENASIIEDLIRIEMKLTKVKSKFQTEHNLTSDDRRKNISSGLRKDRSSNLIRKSVILMTEEISNLLDEQIGKNYSLANDSKDLKKELEKTQLELQMSLGEIDSLRSEINQFEAELADAQNEVEASNERLEELRMANQDLLRENQENPLAAEFARKVESLEEHIDKIREEQQISEIKNHKLRKFIHDEKLLFYIENFAKIKSELQLYEKKQLRLEMHLSKASTNNSRNDVLQEYVRLLE